jgi:hypothetical protein
MAWCSSNKNYIIRNLNNFFFHLKEAAHTTQPVNHFGGVEKSTDLRLLRSLQNFSLLLSFKIEKSDQNEISGRLNGTKIHLSIQQSLADVKRRGKGGRKGS